MKFLRRIFCIFCCSAEYNIIGLDAGTYYLHEELAPQGYNKADDVEIVIEATHTENAAGTAGVLTLSNNTKGLANSIVDTKNSELPLTGGIGTTLFVLGGGCAAGVAGIYLISRKRTKEEDSE